VAATAGGVRLSYHQLVTAATTVTFRGRIYRRRPVSTQF